MSSSNLNQHDKKPIEEYLKRADTIMDKRFLYFAFSVLGKNIEVQMNNGVKGKGQFHTASIDNGGVVVKNFSPLDGSNEKLPTKVMDVKDFVYILASDIEDPPLVNAKKDVFKTDAEISKNKLSDKRTFVKWDAEGEALGGLSLEDHAHEKGKWNQFELNEKRFGLQSHYEENMYTTHLDMKNVSASLLEKASRLEAEILNSAADTDNRHIREERGLQALQEEHEDEEFTYSSVIRTDSKTDKKGDKVEDDRKPRFINTKRQPSTTPTTTTTTTETPQKPSTLTVPAAQTDNKKETKPLEVSANRRDFVPGGSSNVAAAAFKDNDTPSNRLKTADDSNKLNTPHEKTPKASDFDTEKKLSRQASNISEGKKHSLSVTSGAFDAPDQVKPKDETKAPPVKQTSIDLDAEKKAATLTTADFHPTFLAKFKPKLDVKKSSVTFYEYAIPNWQKKPIVHDKISDPSLINPNWKQAKSAAQNQAAAKVITPTSQTTTTASTPKTLHKPNTNAPPFNATPGMPTNNFGNGMMMGQMGQPFIPGGFGQPYMNAGMQFMPPVQKFTPGFPIPQPYMPMQGGMQTFVDPNQPNFNLGMNYHPPHGGRQGGPMNRNYKQNKQQ